MIAGRSYFSPSSREPQLAILSWWWGFKPMTENLFLTSSLEMILGKETLPSVLRTEKEVVRGKGVP